MALFSVAGHTIERLVPQSFAELLHERDVEAVEFEIGLIVFKRRIVGSVTHDDLAVGLNAIPHRISARVSGRRRFGRNQRRLRGRGCRFRGRCRRR